MASKRNLRRAAERSEKQILCEVTGKRCYANARQAEAVKHRLHAEGRVNIGFFLCLDCGWWHVGNRPGTVNSEAFREVVRELWQTRGVCVRAVQAG